MDKIQSHISDLMVRIPKGTVNMRDDRINRKWKVRIDSFNMLSIPVSQKLYYAVTKINPSTFQGPLLPVENVSWMEAVTFCNLLSELFAYSPFYILDEDVAKTGINKFANGFRLPTEAEWQYACQAGSDGARYGELDSIAWYKENSKGSTQNAGRKEPNDWGLYDMLGNVWEWCSDIYDESVYGSYRIFRGGGWNDEARSVMATTRRRSHPASFRIDDLGFRIAGNLQQHFL